MSVFLDIVGSVIIAGLLLLAVLSSYSNVSQYALLNSMDLTVQENLSEWLQIVQHDFRKIGYRVANPAWAIQDCDSSSISFVADIDNNGVVDSVSYYLGLPSQVPGTQNPRDRALYRVVSGQQTGGALGLTDFQLRYYDSTGNLTWTPSAVKAVEIFIQVESPFPLDTTYVWSSWRGLIYPLNLQ
jgi:hypothetical protein